MIDLMIDLETMGSKPGSAIVGLGACFFDVNTGQIGDTFYRAINLATCTRVGLTMDASTVMWWMGQTDAARNAIRFSTYALQDSLTAFSEWVTERCKQADVRVWARGPSFDGSILTAAYRAVNLEPPWNYWNERCHRTLTARNPSVPEPEREGELHNAKDDAVHQAKWLIAIANHHRAKAAA